MYLKKVRYYFVCSLVFTVMLSMHSVAFAGKIGTVDSAKLLELSPQGKKENTRIEELFSARLRELKAKFEVYKAKETEYEKNAMIMSVDETESATSELKRLQIELKQEERKYNEDFGVSKSEGLRNLEKLITEAIAFIAKRDDYEIIFQQAVWADEKIDITGKVLAELEKRAAQ